MYLSKIYPGTYAWEKAPMKRKSTFTKTSAPKRSKTTGGFTPLQKATLKPLLPDTKYYDSDFDNGGIVNIAGASWANAEIDPPTKLNLCSPIKGDDIDLRQANKIYVKSIKIRGFVSIAQQTVQAVADGCAVTRIILYQDMRTANAQTQAENVMASGSATANNVAAFQNPISFGKVRVLKEKYLSPGNPNIAGVTGSVEQNGLQYPFKMNVNFKKPVEVNFSTNDGTITSIVDNSFHVIAATNNGTLAQTLSYKSRVSFYG